MEHKAKVIMVQGTMSNAGKSFLVAGLCRVFMQDGYRTAPFKSQNMALNSYITREGLEIGRAQAMQAEAAGIEPTVDMNPILLKPTSQSGSQVIVNGEVRGNQNAMDYYAHKKELIPEIEKAFGRLSSAYDIIVIEGAGSPAEINLKENDIVNMGMARIADAPVLLAGDIDRGGVFASLYGTVKLLEEEAQKRIKGFIINKFRGDKSILMPGISMLEKRCGIPVAGVTPFLAVDVEDEDSLSERFCGCGGDGVLDIAVVRLPHISNFTDFLVLENQKAVRLRYVKRAGELSEPDMVILPGTKNTMGDLRWLRESGMEAALLRAHAGGAVVFGICGGYQMLGEELCDPLGVEEGGSLRGLGLLAMRTVFAGTKVRTRVRGRFAELSGVLGILAGQEIEGYEIHMGESSPIAEYQGCPGRGFADGEGADPGRMSPFVWTENIQTHERRGDGAFCGTVYGTYVHGSCDADGVVGTLLQALADRKGVALDAPQPVSLEAYREHQFDLLADALREHLDLEAIYKIMGIDGSAR